MINSIRLQNFRSYTDESFEFDPNVNIVVGPNASGKTNLLEAVMVVAQGNSYRVKDADLVKFNAKWARIDGNFGAHQRSLKLENSPTGTNKTYLIDEKPYKRLRAEDSLPIVFFEPNHLQLIIRGPEHRRDYIDGLLASIDPAFKNLNADYRRSLAQRNSLLKKGQARAEVQLFAWNVRLGELGSQIALARHELVVRLNEQLADAYSQIAQIKSPVILEYANQFPIESYASHLVSKLEKNFHNDLARGFTAYGPHREDFVFYLNNQPASATASRGETRSLLLALKTLELGLIEKARQAKPIFLLDDVFSELDGKRRKALVKLLKNNQAIITTTDADAVVEHFAGGRHKLIPISKRKA